MQNTSTQELSDIAVEQVEEANSLVSLQKELDSAKSKLLYLQADFDNYRKRVAKEKQTAYSNGKEDAIFAMLDAIDNMELLLKSIDDSQASKGFVATYNNLIQSLERLGCKKIGCNVGDQFDVNFHEALSTIDDENLKPYSISSICKSGWTIDGKLLRPVMVVVAK